MTSKISAHAIAKEIPPIRVNSSDSRSLLFLVPATPGYVISGSPFFSLGVLKGCLFDAPIETAELLWIRHSALVRNVRTLDNSKSDRCNRGAA